MGQIRDIYLVSEPGTEEIKMTVTVIHVLKDGTPAAKITKTFQLEWGHEPPYDGVSTPSFFVGAWTLAEFNQNPLMPPAINIRTNTTEEDLLSDDDMGEFTTVLEIDPQVAIRHANMGEYGELSEVLRFLTGWKVDTPDSNDYGFSYVVDVRAFLYLR